MAWTLQWQLFQKQLPLTADKAPVHTTTERRGITMQQIQQLLDFVRFSIIPLKNIPQTRTTNPFMIRNSWIIEGEFGNAWRACFLRGMLGFSSSWCFLKKNILRTTNFRMILNFVVKTGLNSPLFINNNWYLFKFRNTNQQQNHPHKIQFFRSKMEVRSLVTAV